MGRGSTSYIAPSNLWGRRGQTSEVHPCRPKTPDYDTEPVMAYANDPDFAA